MSNELMKNDAPGPLVLRVTDQELQEVKEAFLANMAAGNFSEFDLPRITIQNGDKPAWAVPDLDGTKTMERIEGIVIFMRDMRVYYKDPNGPLNTPPDCSSRDGKTGEGDPGGDCQACPLSKWDSAANAGQACKTKRQLFILRDDSLFPEIVSLPPTSLKSCQRFLLQLGSKGAPYYGVLLAMELEKALNPQKKPYGKAVFKAIRKLTPEEKDRALFFAKFCQPFAATPPQADAGDYDFVDDEQA